MILSINVFVLSLLLILIIHFIIKNILIIYSKKHTDGFLVKNHTKLNTKKLNTKLNTKKLNTKKLIKNDLLDFVNKYNQPNNVYDKSPNDLNKFFEIQNNELYLFKTPNPKIITRFRQ